MLATKGSCPPYEKSVPTAEPDSAEEPLPLDAAAPSAAAEQPAQRKRKAEVGRPVGRLA